MEFLIIITGQVPSVGVRCQRAEDDKYRKHLQACRLAGYGFQAFAVDVFGFVAARSAELLLRFQSAVALRSGRVFSVVVDEVNRQLSCALQVALSVQLLSHRPLVEEWGDGV